jgi:hypothetical protein
VRGVHRHFVGGPVALLDPEVKVLDVQVEVRVDVLVLDHRPDHARHLVAVKLHLLCIYRRGGRRGGREGGRFEMQVGKGERKERKEKKEEREKEKKRERGRRAFSLISPLLSPLSLSLSFVKRGRA